MKAEIHPRQEERLAHLRRYEILDTPRESDFDDIVELASQICETPISVVNLIDMDRQWFKAEVGLGVRETPLETSLCSHAILEHRYMEIPDTLADDRTADNPLCLDVGGLRFYAGYLLESDAGLPLGTLCVLDTRPRQLTDLQRNALRVLARQVMHQLDLRRALSHHEMMRKEIDHRVKNSLQSVGAYVRQRRRRSESEEARSTLSAVETRIESVASLHEQFYRADSTEGLDLQKIGNRLEELTEEICPPGIALDIALPKVIVDSRTASALSMVVNEFVANSIKHAFDGRTEGQIRVTGSVAGDGIDISCSDDGIGGSGSMTRADGSTGLGIRIIDAALGQLGATAHWRRGAGGTRVSFHVSRPAAQLPDAGGNR